MSLGLCWRLGSSNIRFPWNSWLIRAAVVLVAAYGSAVGYMSLRETSLVYPGMHRTFRMVPGRDVGIPWDTLRVIAADSTPVLLLESRVDTVSRRPWALYLHGNLGLLGARGNVARYHLIREAGFNVLAVEYRGFGASASAGRPSEKGLYSDAAAAWNHLTGTLAVPPDRVMLYGLSLGGGPASLLAAEHAPAALVTEGMATSLAAVGARRYPWLPVGLIMRNKFRNLARAPTIAIPWVIFHGRNDRTVPFSHAEKLAGAAPRTQLVPLVADHDGGVIEDRVVALTTLLDLARRIAAPADTASVFLLSERPR